MLDRQRWLPTWALNVLGLIYLPLAFLDVFVVSRRLLTAVLHLILFALLVKLFSLTRERDKWQVAIGIFFLFLASMGTSVHPTIVLYLIAFLVISLVMLTRFAFLHVLAGFGREDPELARIPMRGFLIACTLLTLVLSVPLFAFLPRVPSPYIVGRGSGLGQTIESAGFSDEVTLDSIGQIRNSRDVALRLLEEGTSQPGRRHALQGGELRPLPGRDVAALALAHGAAAGHRGASGWPRAASRSAGRGSSWRRSTAGACRCRWRPSWSTCRRPRWGSTRAARSRSASSRRSWWSTGWGWRQAGDDREGSPRARPRTRRSTSRA